MHQLNVLVLGPDSFISTLNELRTYLKFNIFSDINNLNKASINKYDVLFFHKKFLEDKQNTDIINNFSSIKILATEDLDGSSSFNAILRLPTTLNDLNAAIESSVAKKVFNKNSSIKIKDFLLNKNEKKLAKDNKFIILTEKEIQLLELFLNNKKPISKSKILSFVWNYSSDADTHTVETHIYRLRKKISDKFSDENLILNNKEGYYI
jgi:hypothetical protein